MSDTTKPRLRIDSGWLVEERDECTIGCEPQYGHQPGCGMLPLQRLDDLPGWPAAARPAPVGQDVNAVVRREQGCTPYCDGPCSPACQGRSGEQGGNRG